MDARHIHLNYNATSQHSSPRDIEQPASAFRGILVGLWLTSTSILLLALVPGLGISIGNLPGDIVTGTRGSVRLPIASIALVVVTLTGLYFRIASHRSRH